MTRKLFLLLAVSGLLTLGSCYYDKAEVLYPAASNCQLNAHFSVNVNPIIQNNCAISPDCHASGTTNTGGPLTNYTQIKNMAVVIRGQVISRIMPKTGSLTQEQINTIVCWIDAGAPNN